MIALLLQQTLKDDMQGGSFQRFWSETVRLLPYCPYGEIVLIREQLESGEESLSRFLEGEKQVQGRGRWQHIVCNNHVGAQTCERSVARRDSSSASSMSYP